MLVFAWGGNSVLIGAMSVGSLVAFIQYLNRLYNPSFDLMYLYNDVVKASVAMTNLSDILKYPVNQSPKKIKKDDFEEISFNNVSFRYSSQRVLTNFNWKIQRNKKYAIIGLSGSGKSTIINLLCKFCSPESGTILIDDVDLKELSQESWNKLFAVIHQDTFLFNETVADNIAYGSFQSDQVAIHEASRLSRVDEFINNLSKNFHTKVHDRGSSLSTGQIQRIAIARMFLKKSKIILLDESTSGLDLDTEKYVLDNLWTTCSDQTIILITHRINALKRVDEIVCLENGSIVESGSHSQLLARRGFYWRLHSLEESKPVIEPIV